MRKVILVIALCFVLSACTSKEQSASAEKRSEPPYPYFLTSDKYDLNGDGLYDFFGIYSDPVGFDDYGKPIPAETIHVFFNNEPYTEKLSNTYGFNYYNKYNTISIVGGDYDGDGADEIAYLRYCEEEKRFAISVEDYKDGQFRSLDVPEWETDSQGFYYEQVWLHENTLYFEPHPISNSQRPLSDYTAAFANLGPQDKYPKLPNMYSFDHIETITHDGKDALLCRYPINAGYMWITLTWGDETYPYRVEEEWFQPLGMERDTFRSYTLSNTGCPRAFPERQEGDTSYDYRIDYIIENLPGEVHFEGRDKGGRFWITDSDGNIVWERSTSIISIYPKFTADATSDKQEDLILVGEVLSESGQLDKQVTILDIVGKNLYPVTLNSGGPITDMQMIPYKDYYVISLEHNGEWTTLGFNPQAPEDNIFKEVSKQELEQNHPMNLFLKNKLSIGIKVASMK